MLKGHLVDGCQDWILWVKVCQSEAFELESTACMFLEQASFWIPYPSEMFPLDASASVIHVKDKCAPYLGLWVNSLVGFSILSSFSISKIDLFLILPNAPHTRVRADCREFKLRLHTSHRFIFLELSLWPWFHELVFAFVQGMRIHVSKSTLQKLQQAREFQWFCQSTGKVVSSSTIIYKRPHKSTGCHSAFSFR